MQATECMSNETNCANRYRNLAGLIPIDAHQLYNDAQTIDGQEHG